MTDEIPSGDEPIEKTNREGQFTFSGVGEQEEHKWQKPWNSALESLVVSVQRHIRSTGRRIFGDRYGLTLFCAALAFFAVSWRIGVLVNDSYTVANGLVAVSEGQLHVDRAVYGPGLETPGMNVVDGVAHARNYGQIIMALPFLWAIQGVYAVADLRVAFAGGWALLLLGLSILIGELLNRDVFGRESRTLSTYIGSVLALAAFVLVVRGATTIDPVWHHILALQMQTMVAAGFIGVVVYRLLNRIHGRKIGLAAGATVVFVSPIGLWSSFPKRHVLVALGVFVSIYCLYRSRESLSRASDENTWHLKVANRSYVVTEMTRFRALAYVPVGIIVWVNALEGLLLLGALIAVDVPTGGRRFRSLAVAWGSCLVSLVPMFLTNFLIAGNPLEPPMAYGKYGSGGLAKQSGVGGTGTGSASGGTTSTTIDSFVGALTVASEYIIDGAAAVTSELDMIFFAFVRSGYVADTNGGGDALRLSFFEAMPVAVVLVVLPIILWRNNVRQRMSTIVEYRRLSPIATIDVFVLIYSVAVTLVFLPNMGVNAQITVRYLLVLFPLAVYGIARLSSVRRIISDRYRTCFSVYLAGVMIGGQVLILFMYANGSVVDESVQIHAYVNLSMAVFVAGWGLADISGYQYDRIGAIVLSLAAASGTVFILLARLLHMDVGPLAFPLL